MDQKGMEITKRNGRITIKKPNGETIMEGRLRGNLYEINSIIAPHLGMMLPSQLTQSPILTSGMPDSDMLA